MTKLTRLAGAAVLIGLLATPALAGGSTSPAGSWRSTDGKASVRVTMCGDGTQLCARLTGLSGDARTPENVHLLNSYVVDRAAMADSNEWLGTLHFNGQTAEGHIKLVSYSTIVVSGCELGMCKTLNFRRVGAAPASATVAEAAPQNQARTVSLTLPE
jgi:hypothetical protein